MSTKGNNILILTIVETSAKEARSDSSGTEEEGTKGKERTAGTPKWGHVQKTEYQHTVKINIIYKNILYIKWIEYRIPE